MKIRVGSRESRLAVIQAQMLIDSIKANNPEVETELVTMKTKGDIILDRTLDKVGGKGLFVKELEKALLDGRIDLIVHSFKDMPMEVDERIPVTAVSKRELPNDVLILAKGQAELDFSKPIGCSSLRRKLQLEKLFPECTVKSVRGNVLTRLDKLDSGEYGALVLAYAGVKRLGLEDRISRIFTTDEIMPAACQGILAIQTRKDFDVSLLGDFADKESMIISSAERSLIKELDGGCSSPFAAYAELSDGGMLTLHGLYSNADKTARLKITVPAEQGVQAGVQLAKMLKAECGE